MKEERSRMLVERQVHTYAEMLHTARSLLIMGKNQEEGSFFQFMSSLVFSAFTLEAYLNHLGDKLFRCWDKLERGLSPMDKLHIIAEKIELNIDLGKRPFQSLNELFKFRNSLAHGKSEVVTEEKTISSNAVADYLFYTPLTKWEEYCNQENASKALDDVEKIIAEIHHKANIDGEILFFGGLISGSFE
jgi:hypothetical protein